MGLRNFSLDDDSETEVAGVKIKTGVSVYYPTMQVTTDVGWEPYPYWWKLLEILKS